MNSKNHQICPSTSFFMHCSHKQYMKASDFALDLYNLPVFISKATGMNLNNPYCQLSVLSQIIQPAIMDVMT